MTEREKFEKWFYNNVKNFPFASEFERNAFKKYADIVWQASREAMKPIKLPCATFETPSGDNAFSEDDVIEAIQQAGYKVEE